MLKGIKGADMRDSDNHPQHARDQIVEVIARMYRVGLSTSSSGNLSIRDKDGNIWITPTAVDKGRLQAKDIVCMGADGMKKYGSHRHSAGYAIHRAIYQARPDLSAVMHTYPPAMISFAMIHALPNLNIIPQAREVCGEMGYVAGVRPGSGAIVGDIARQFKRGRNAVLVENQGTVVGGMDIMDALIRIETIEFAARTIVGASAIGEPGYLSDDQIDLFESRSTGDLRELEQVDHPEQECSIRNDISSIACRSSVRGMMNSSYGSISVHWNGDDFLITPSTMSRKHVCSEDIVQIRGGRRERGKYPSLDVSLHQKIYRHNPQINSIILTQTSNLMALGVARKKTGLRFTPGSQNILHDISIKPFGYQYTDPDKTARTFGPDQSAILFENDGFIMTGDTLLETFNRLEVAEFSARSLVMGHKKGDWRPISA